MSEIIISQGIIIDDADYVFEGLQNCSSQPIRSIETVVKFIQKESATHFYINDHAKCTLEREPDSLYLWLDTGLTNKKGEPIFISLLRTYGEFVGHFYGTANVLVGSIRKFAPRYNSDIQRNFSTFVNKYEHRIRDRKTAHIEEEFEFLAGSVHDKEAAEEPQTEFARLFAKLDLSGLTESSSAVAPTEIIGTADGLSSVTCITTIGEDNPETTTAAASTEIIGTADAHSSVTCITTIGVNNPATTPAATSAKIMDFTPAATDWMDGTERELTISFLLDTIQEMAEVINELKNENADLHTRYNLVMKENQESAENLFSAEQMFVKMREFLVSEQIASPAAIEKAMEQMAELEAQEKELQDVHDLLAKRKGKILVLGASQLDVKTMQALARDYGFAKDDFEYITDYEKVVKSAGRITGSSRYAAIIFGCCPHKVEGLGTWTSIMRKCEMDPEMPPAFDARTKNGTLKVTKQSYREALVRICDMLKAELAG